MMWGKLRWKKGLEIRSYRLYALLLLTNFLVKDHASDIQDFTVTIKHRCCEIMFGQHLGKNNKSVCLFGVLRLRREFFTHTETSLLLVKGFKFWHIFGTHGHRAVRVLQHATPMIDGMIEQLKSKPMIDEMIEQLKS